MATRISLLLDYLEEILEEALPEHAQLLDPDDLTENPDATLKKGWGYSVGQAENSERELSGSVYWYRREFTIILTRSNLSLYSDGASKLQALKDILEDLNLVLQEMKGTRVVMASDGSQTAFDFKFVRDSGPRATDLNDVPHLFIELTVSAEYRET